MFIDVYELKSWFYFSLSDSLYPEVESMIVIVKYDDIMIYMNKILKSDTRSQYTILYLLKNYIRTNPYIINSSVYEGWDIQYWISRIF